MKSVRTNKRSPSPFITHHSALNVMNLFRIFTQNHGSIPTHCYHFEHSHRDQYSDCLCQRYTTNTVDCETHAILDCPYPTHLALPLIRKIRTLLHNVGQSSWDSLLIPQQISLILGNPPELLPQKLHKAWTEATLKEILPNISSLETLLYT